MQGSAGVLLGPHVTRVVVHSPFCPAFEQTPELHVPHCEVVGGEVVESVHVQSLLEAQGTLGVLPTRFGSQEEVTHGVLAGQF